MAKGFDLSRVLLAAALFFCSNLVCLDLKAGVFDNTTLSEKRKLIRKIYSAEVGVRETANNAGPRVETYQRYAHVPWGSSWCAAFVCWVYGQAGVKNPRNGWSPAMFPPDRVVWQCRKLINPVTPKTGDVFGIWFRDKGRVAHVGFVDEWDGGWVTTVEGNTSLTGIIKGEGVERKRRLVSIVCVVASYAD